MTGEACAELASSNLKLFDLESIRGSNTSV